MLASCLFTGTHARTHVYTMNTHTMEEEQEELRRRRRRRDHSIPERNDGLWEMRCLGLMSYINQEDLKAKAEIFII